MKEAQLNGKRLIGPRGISYCSLTEPMMKMKAESIK
jgi:hypothetical protein